MQTRLQSLLAGFLLLLLTQTTWADSEQTQDLPLKELRIFSEIFHQIRQHYVSDVTDRELLDHAIRGMLSGLDPHSAYLDKEDFLALQESTTGEFAGLGLEVTLENGMLKVIAPIDDTPAQRAGIVAGDIIIKIGEQMIKGLSLDESIELMRGPKGSTVSLTILRDSETAPLEFKLERDIIKIRSVKSRIIDNHYAYLRIAQFQNKTAEDAHRQILDMEKNRGKPLQGLIIDLRNNPGGILESAIALSDLFIREGLIVYTKGRHNESLEEFFATETVIMEGKPIIVLINNGSASASEIVAGALQDHKRAMIVGTTSFGKGSVQTILPLPDDNAIKLTTARYYTPLGRSIQARGIQPDIIARRATLTPQEQSSAIKEANLARHIDKDEGDEPPATEQDMQLLNDYQLYEAVNLIKAMQFSMDVR